MYLTYHNPSKYPHSIKECCKIFDVCQKNVKYLCNSKVDISFYKKNIPLHKTHIILVRVGLIKINISLHNNIKVLLLQHNNLTEFKLKLPSNLEVLNLYNNKLITFNTKINIKLHTLIITNIKKLKLNRTPRYFDGCNNIKNIKTNNKKYFYIMMEYI